MKLIVQIPCYNEEKDLARVLKSIPESIRGISSIETIVIDDGSCDQTAEIARNHGVRVVSLPERTGLANAFLTGIRNALILGADIIVNTDGDNQYEGRDIKRLIRPILTGSAEFVIGTRPRKKLAVGKPVKKLLYRMGGGVVSTVIGTTIDDPTSGFRAYSSSFASKIRLMNHYTHTLETIVLAAHLKTPIATVPIRINTTPRPSRLIRSMPEYLMRNGWAFCSSRLYYKADFIYRAVYKDQNSSEAQPAVFG